MSRIAVDIVLLPDHTMAARAIEVNANLDQSGARRIDLDAATCLPHISLAMGCIDRGDVPSIADALRAVLAEHPVSALAITGVVTSLNGRGEAVSAFALRATPALQALHEAIMEAMQPFFSYDVAETMLHGDEPVAATSLEWIRTFRQKAAFRVFFPHLTLGYGEVVAPMQFPADLTARTLAVCHLGNHCTCREVLAEVNT